MIIAVVIVGSTNFGTVYIYIYEKSFRRLYIVYKKLQAVLPRFDPQ